MSALLGPHDVLIVPDLGDITFVSFDKAEDAISIGEKAARDKIGELRKFSASEQRWIQFSRRERATALAPLEVDSVRLVNASRVDDRLVRDALTIDPPEDLDRRALIFDILSLYNSRYFGVISFELDEVEPEVKELVIETPASAFTAGLRSSSVSAFSTTSTEIPATTCRFATSTSPPTGAVGNGRRWSNSVPSVESVPRFTSLSTGACGGLSSLRSPSSREFRTSGCKGKPSPSTSSNDLKPALLRDGFSGAGVRSASPPSPATTRVRRASARLNSTP